MRREEASRKGGRMLAGRASGGETAAWFVADETHAGRQRRHLRLTGAMPK